MKTKPGGYKRISSGSADALKCRTKNNRKRKRTSNYQIQHQNRMKTICFYYIRKYFWKYKSNAKKRIKEKYNIDTNLEVKSFTNTKTFDGNYIGVGKVTRRAHTKSVAREDGSFSKLELKRAFNYAINTLKLKKFRKQNVGRERKATIKVFLYFIRDCNEVNIENGDNIFINSTIVEDRKEKQLSKGV
ncbi:uncharacterized protein LOC131949441 [Physella acuta]|uniref:uncharacterized protein LOC131949441 n=1 Tax=Physella acuta TaxID=109671 RepID=UPI0027DD6BF9|nr:uncharacterized protein LOC131949441 [Physella acuta]